MKSLFLYACAGLMVLSSGAAAAPHTVQRPLLGAWAVDTARLQMPSEARPKSVTITFAEAADGKLSTTVDIVAPDDSKRHLSAAYRPDGSVVHFGGDDAEADAGAVVMPAPNVMILALAKSGRPGSTRVYTVAPDGRTMTEEAVNWDDSGNPVIRTNYFTRLRK